MASPTHYDLLALAPDATYEQIREAYRRMARAHHPDRAPTSGGDDRTMPAINEAYRVLSDPARRAVYDATLRTGSAVGSSAPRASAPDQAEAARAAMPTVHEPARVPWRSLLFFATIAVIGVFVLAQFTEPAEPPAPDGLLRIGSCVEIEPNGFAREVSCTRDETIDLVVGALVPFGGRCPVGTEPHQDRQGMGVACIDVTG
ncbi:MAG: J domain-containing protein [Ilumatobacteraceae bacterium]